MGEEEVGDAFQFPGVNNSPFAHVKIKMTFSLFKGWNQLNHQPVSKFLHFFLASLQTKTAGISKLVDDEDGSIL